MSQADHDRRVDYIEIPVTDVARAKRFYQDAFGWEFTDYGPDYTSFTDGRLSGGLRLDAASPANGALVVIYTVDLEAMRARIPALGGKLVGGILVFPGGRRFHFTDSSGNELAVWTDH